jgi:hypothetical protein
MYINSEMIIASITIGGCTGVLISLVRGYTKYKNMRAGILKTREEYDRTHQEEEEKYIIEETNITSGVELWGRKKGKFCWYPFDGEVAFNNNVAVVEGNQRASNDGLRFMQELSNSIIEQKDNDVNMYLIEEGVKAVWKEKKEKAGISDLIKWMLQTKSNPKENAEYVAGMLSRYGETGKHGRYFNGKADLDLESDFSAISFDEVEEVRKVLVAGVLTYIQVKDMQYGVKSCKGIIRDLIGDFKNKADKIFIEGYLRTQRLYKKGVISNISPQDEIIKLINESSSSTCCMSYDEGAIKRLAEKSFLWRSAKKMGESSYKYPEYLIAAEDSIPYLLRGNLKERGHA